MDEFLLALLNGPLAVSFYGSANFETYDGSSPLDCMNIDFFGNESNYVVIATGYHIDVNNPENSYVEFKHTWGTSWGDDGFFKMRLYDYTTDLDEVDDPLGSATTEMVDDYNSNGPCGIFEDSSLILKAIVSEEIFID